MTSFFFFQRHIKCFKDKLSRCLNIHELVKQCLLAYLGQAVANTKHP